MQPLQSSDELDEPNSYTLYFLLPSLTVKVH